MPRIPNSVLERAIMRQKAKEAADREIMRQKARLDAERAIRMRQQHSNDIMNRFRPTDEELDEIIRIEDIERHNSRIPHYLPNDARMDGYEQHLPYYPGRDAATRQRTMEFRYGRDDVNPPIMDDGVFRPSEQRYRNGNVRPVPLSDFDYEELL